MFAASIEQLGSPEEIRCGEPEPPLVLGRDLVGRVVLVGGAAGHVGGAAVTLAAQAGAG